MGGGSVATRKAKTLLDAGAIVRVVSLHHDDELIKLSIGNKDLVLEKKSFEEGDLDSASIIIAATDDKKTNQLVSTLAKDNGLWVNVVDDPELCNFFLPSIVTRGDLTIAVSTQGKCPALAKKIRQMLESQFDPFFETLLKHLSVARLRLSQKYPDDSKKRGEIMNKIVDSCVVENAQRFSEDEILKEINKWL